MDYKKSFLKRSENCDINIAILGMGYVGLPLALAFSESKIKTFGIDIDQVKIDSLNNEIGRAHV